MGNLNCAKCCQGSELKQEIDLKFSVKKIQISALSIQKETQSSEPTGSIQKSVIRIQTFWRRWKSIKILTSLKETSHKSPYFSDDELFETLLSEIPSSKLSFSHTYSTGTIYQGDWFGGFRHGEGHCTWTDGSKYSGSWSFNYPFGEGTFTFKDGETFTGQWKNPFASIKNRSFLEDVIQGKRDGFGKD
jgi:hypothetical protein